MAASGARTKSFPERLVSLAQVSIAFLVSLAAATSAHAAPVLTTFDTDAEGWTVGDFLPASTSTSLPVHVTDGAARFIRAFDYTHWTAYHAPTNFRDDVSSAYGSALSFNLRVSASDGLVYAAVILSDGTTALQYRDMPTANVWSHFIVPLVATAGWERLTDGKVAGPAATEAELQTVLSGLQYLHINSDWLTGNDYADLDNIGIIDTPEPTSMFLLGAGLASLALVRRAVLRR